MAGILGPGEGRGLLIFDADDTLWWTEQLYTDAKAECRQMAIEAGLDGDAWIELMKQVDVGNVPRFGLTKRRFPTSTMETYEKLAGDAATDAWRERFRAAGATVFTRMAPLVDGVHEILAGLAQDGWRLVLLTQGDREVQWERIAASGLAGFFTSQPTQGLTLIDEPFDNIWVVTKKTEESFAKILTQDGRPPEATWSVGNSLPSDINPALRLEMNAVWVPAHTWEWEHREKTAHEGGGRLLDARALAEVPALVESGLVVEELLA